MEEESDNPLGDYVRSVMQENGLSAQDVSNIALRKEYEIGRATIGQIVNGKTPNPGIHTLDALAAGIDRPLEILLEKALGRTIGDEQVSPDFATLSDLYQQLPLTEQRGVKRYWLQALEREMRRILTRLSGSD